MDAQTREYNPQRACALAGVFGTGLESSIERLNDTESRFLTTRWTTWQRAMPTCCEGYSVGTQTSRTYVYTPSRHVFNNFEFSN
eukprot:8125500-Pyramimonas_sp.AAC.2